MKNLLYIILAVNLCSCGVYKKSILDRYCLPSSIKGDTVVVKHIDSSYIKKYDSIVNRPATIQTIIVNSPCDSNGLLKKFEQQSVSGKDTITVYSDGKKIYVKGNCDACEQRYEALMELYYKKTDSTVVHVEYITKIKEPIYNWWERFKLSWAANIIILLGFPCILLTLYLLYKTIKEK